MDFSKIRLANERNSHVTKRLNRLSTWQFFKVIYRENIWRMFGFSFLMMLCVVPMLIMLLLGSIQDTAIQQSLPVLNSFGFSSGSWLNFAEYQAKQLTHNHMQTGLLTAATALVLTIMLSGGFAVIRDAFWTGKLSTVGVFKSMGKGFKANILYAFVSVAVIAMSVFGIYAFYAWGVTVMPLWLTIVLVVLLSIVALFVAMYLFILCSVSVTYKQSVYENLDDSWRLLWLNVLPNLVHFLMLSLPIALYLIAQTSMLQSLVLVVLFMFGGIYFPLVWQTHMMKTFALFHPIEVKKKKKASPPQNYKSTNAHSKKQLTDGVDVNVESETDGEVEEIETVEESDDDSIAQSEANAYAEGDEAYADQSEDK